LLSTSDDGIVVEYRLPTYCVVATTPFTSVTARIYEAAKEMDDSQGRSADCG